MADIFQTAANADFFKTLVTVIEAAGLLDLLQTPAPYTSIACSIIKLAASLNLLGCLWAHLHFKLEKLRKCHN
ncbi:hypothetical protein QUB75_20675 [Microcoleus sp. K1-B6]|uniref:hypothetical protein n=1 Tax=unclassified Microcoleus TaxID=2642155 RepID=UPI002FD0B66C